MKRELQDDAEYDNPNINESEGDDLLEEDSTPVVSETSEEDLNQDSYYDYYDSVNRSQVTDECFRLGESKVAVLTDEWTPTGKSLPNCTFPFYWKGKTYYTCTNEGGFGNRFWCANSCDFSEGNPLHRGYCNIGLNTRGVFGTGISLSFLNIFVALILSIAFVVLLILLIIEWRRRKLDTTQILDGSDEKFNQSVEMTLDRN